MSLVEQTRCGGNADVKRLILQQWVDVITKNEHNDIALCCECENGTKVVQYLLDSGAYVNLGENPLIAAVRYNYYDCVKVLLQHNADFNCTNTKLETPMSVAVHKHHYSIILLLLQYGAIPSALLSDIVAVQLLKHARVEHARAIQKLIDESVIDLTSESTFRAAFSFVVRYGLQELAERWLSNDNYSKLEQQYPDAVYYSARNNWSKVLSKLLGKGADVNVLTEGETPLYAACKEGHEYVVDLLLDSGADPNVPNELATFSSAVQVAVRRGSAVIVDKLLEKGAKLDQRGEPLLHIACSCAAEWKTAGEAGETRSVEDRLSIIRVLLQRGVNVNAISDDGDTAVYRASISQQLQVVQILLEAGADVNLTSKSHYPLIAACNSGNSELINLLVNSGADVNSSATVNATNKDGETPLSVVCDKRQPDVNIIEMLLKFGADPNTFFPLHATCENNNLDAVRLLLAYGADTNLVKESVPLRTGVRRSLLAIPVTIPKHTEPSPLCIACKNGNIAMIECLLQSGADATFADGNGKSVLHFALERLGQQANTEEYDPIVTLLLQHNAAVNVVSNSGETPLFVACMKGNTGMVKQLLDCGAKANLNTSSWNKYPLLIASARGFREIAITLLDRGADANVRQSNQTPLKLAAANGDAVLVKKLLNCGAEVNQLKSISDTALHTATIHCNSVDNESFVKIVQMLLKSGAKVNALNHRGETSLCLACKRTVDAVNIHIVQTLLEYGADPNTCPLCIDLSSCSSDRHNNILPPLLAAASCSNSELSMLLIKFGARLDQSDNFGRTALHFAIDNYHTRFTRRSKSAKNDTSTSEILLSAGADLNAVDSSGASPLYLACERGKTEFVKLLLGRGASPNTGTADKHPIHAACRGHHFDLVTQLLEYNADVTVRDGCGKTALHHALKSMTDQFSGKSNAIVQLLLDRGADVDAVSNDGETPFYLACSNGLTSVVARMLEYGAKLHGNSGKKLPLHAACRNKQVWVVHLLLASGADPNIVEESNEYPYECRNRHTLPLFMAVADGISELVELLLRYGANIDVTDTRGNTPLYHAVERCHQRATLWKHSHEVITSSNAKSVIDVLLENKADVNIVNNYGETPLYRAACNEMLDVVSKMLQVYGGNPNKVSPLFVACLTENAELVDMLLMHGADPNLTSTLPYHGSRHELPLFIAVDKDNGELVELLLKHGANVDITDIDGNTPLHHAIDHCSQSSRNSHEVAASNTATSVIDVLLENKADVNIVNKLGETSLYRAACNEMLDVVRKMLQVYGGNPNKVSALLVACLTENAELVHMLLKHKADPNLTSRLPYHGSRQELPLFVAVDKDNGKLVELLLKHGANIDVTDIDGNTPLHHAIDHCSQSPRNSHDVAASNTATSVIDVLLENKADVNIVNNFGETSLYRAACNEMLDVVRKMLQVYGGNPNKLSLLFAACLTENAELVGMLLKHGADPNPTSTGRYHCLPLLFAVDNDNSELVALLLKHGANVDVTDIDGNTPLHHAIDHCYQSSRNSHKVAASNTATSVIDILLKRGSKSAKHDTSTAEILLSAGADINAVNSSGASPLYLACERGKTEFVKLLLGRGASPNSGTADKYPILAACIGHHFDLVTQLLEYNADVTVRDGCGKTALHHALKSMTVQFTDESNVLVQLLLDRGADVDALSNNSETPFYIACSNGLTSVVARMLEYGAKVHGNSGKKRPLNAACRNNHVWVVHLLLANGADPNIVEESYEYPYECCNRHTLPLFMAVADESSELVELLLKHGANVDVTDTRGNTPLYRAVEQCHQRAILWKHSHEVITSSNAKSVIDVLLENKADINIVNNYGETPLYRAACNGMLDVVSKMLQVYGGNPNKVSPLFAACLTENTELVRMLLKHGGDPNLTSTGTYHSLRHELPLFFAVNKGNGELVELLLKHGANVDVTDIDGNTPLHHAIDHCSQLSRNSHEVVSSSTEQAVIYVLLENKGDVNILNNFGESALYRAARSGMLDVVSKMLQVYGGNPNSPDNPLAHACIAEDTKLVDVLLKHGADPNVTWTSGDFDPNDTPLFIAAAKGNSDIIMSLLNAGASVNAVSREGINVVSFAAESLTNSYCDSTKEFTKKLSAIRLLLQHGASFSMLMRNGQSPLCLLVDALDEDAFILGDWNRTCVELLQLMVKHGAMLQDDISRQSLNSKILRALATFDGKHKFVVDLLQAGAGLQLIASFCNAVATRPRKAKSICMCQAAVLAGYTPSANELRKLQWAATSGGVLHQLVKWLNEDRQQPPSLLRQCRVVIRRQLSAAVHYQTILPAIDKLPLPSALKLYLQFDGRFSEVDLNVNEEPRTDESDEEGSEYGDDFLSDFSYSDDDYDNNSGSDSDDDYDNNSGSDSDDDYDNNSGSDSDENL